MTPSPESARLGSALRELKERTGLSLAGLAAKTAFSKSSWERYLNGKTLPPRTAVEELCRLAGEPEGRCLALWEIAESEWSGRAGVGAGGGAVRSSDTAASDTAASDTAVQAPPPEAEPGVAQEAPSAGHRTLTLVAVLASVCAVALGGVALALLLLPRHHADDHRSTANPSPSSPSSPFSVRPRCRGAACDGRSPVEMYCGAQPDTLAQRRMATGAWMEVRYSKVCGATWARTWGTRVGDRIEVSAGGPVRGARIRNGADADAFIYTPMVVTRPGAVVRACFLPTTGKRQCFESRVG
ncbi:helix-turn-helix domain-containing protein [Streptomyces sp. CA-249302]|uniref:helix-turn-helix domain-containing protein n=1 Tax=Streptomyces sp. CA-249302 TaxID=3240058 RepID=UPI003D913B0A